MLDIIKLDKEEYTLGKKFLFEYTSAYYYDISVNAKDENWHFDLTLEKFEKPIHERIMMDIFTEYKSDLQVYLALFHTDEVGIISFNHLIWNNSIRIWDLYVKKEFQGKAIGSKLLKYAEEEAHLKRARAIKLETQTSNYQAIKFYQKHNFEIIGFDTLHYSNDDVIKKQVKIEMGKKLKT